MISTTFQVFALALASSFTQHVAAIPAPAPAVTTLPVIPIFNPQSSAYPAVVLGVDSQGRTTYAIEQDEREPSTTIPLTATLVEGADYASYTFSASIPGLQVAAGFECNLNGGQAVCSGIDSNSKIATATFSSLDSFVVDILSTAAPSGQTSKPNSSPKLSASLSGALIALVMVAHSLLDSQYPHTHT
ncbi:hypothetical protein MVEN_02013100 [Mycena venus]|uniref:Uncharacterized protein n=1 Tax=Mycena venus TaxID=2733690 RepID=A0A8H7CHS9_9AGAR|nr:hypothetical protein MVEN_02013100 [Mycena venus]